MRCRTHRRRAPEQRLLQLQLLQDGEPCQTQQAHHGAWGRPCPCCVHEHKSTRCSGRQGQAAAARMRRRFRIGERLLGKTVSGNLQHFNGAGRALVSNLRSGLGWCARRHLHGCCGLRLRVVCSPVGGQRLCQLHGLPACGAMLRGQVRRGRLLRPLSPPRPASLEHNSPAAECKLGASPPSLPRLKKQKRDSSHQKKNRPHPKLPPWCAAGAPACQRRRSVTPRWARPGRRAAQAPPASPGGGLGSGTARLGAVGGAARRGPPPGRQRRLCAVEGALC